MGKYTPKAKPAVPGPACSALPSQSSIGSLLLLGSPPCLEDSTEAHSSAMHPAVLQRNDGSGAHRPGVIQEPHSDAQFCASPSQALISKGRKAVCQKTETSHLRLPLPPEHQKGSRYGQPQHSAALTQTRSGTDRQSPFCQRGISTVEQNCAKGSKKKDAVVIKNAE